MSESRWTRFRLGVCVCGVSVVLCRVSVTPLIVGFNFFFMSAKSDRI